MTSFAEPAGLGEALRAAATLELYRNNAFRVTGLPVDATSAEVRRRVTQVRAVRALGAETPQAQAVLALDPPADTEQVEQALSRLREPMTLVVDGFFWFWPAGADGPPDAGLAALQAGDVERAERAWEAAGTEVAQHNLAVLNHALALDDEHAGKPLPSSGAPLRWRRAYQHWQAFWRSDRCWEVFADRVARFGQPGFGPSTAPALRERLPLMLASISAAVAVRNAEQGLPDEAVLVHWRLAGHQGLPAGTRAEAVSAATESIAKRVQAQVEYAARVARERPPAAGQAAQRLHDQAGPLLRTLALSGAPDADGWHDAVARQMLECASLFHQHSSDLPGTLTVLRLAQRVARGSVAGQIREHVLGLERALAQARPAPQKGGGSRFEVTTIGEETPEARQIRDALQAALDDYQGRSSRGELTDEELRRERGNTNDLIPEETLVELANKFSKQGREKRIREAVEAALQDYQQRRERGELTEEELERQRRSGSDVVPVETLTELADQILRAEGDAR